MCNFYIMYYMDADMENYRGRDTCGGNSVPLITEGLPEDSDTPLPANPLLEEHAKGHNPKHVDESTDNPDGSLPQLIAAEGGKGILKGDKSSSIVDKAKIDDNENHFIQGGRKLAASDSDDYNSLVARPNPYLSDYDYPDYYDIMRQRMRVKKPMYEDFLGSRMNGFSDYNEPSNLMADMMAGQSKSRNRNKFFEAANRQYNDYSNESPLQEITPKKGNVNSDSKSLLNPSHASSDQSDTKGGNSDSGKSTPRVVPKPVTDAPSKAGEVNEGIHDFLELCSLLLIFTCVPGMPSSH